MGKKTKTQPTPFLNNKRAILSNKPLPGLPLLLMSSCNYVETNTTTPTGQSSGKYHCSYNQVHVLCQNAAALIKQDGFQPDLILAIGGGGFIPARMLRTHLGVPIKTVSLELYNDQTKQAGDVVKMTQWIDSGDITGKTVLIVDEVDDTRTTLAFCVSQVRKMNPSKVGIFVVHNKQKSKRCNGHWKSIGFQHDVAAHGTNNNSDDEIDYYRSGEDLSDRWIVYPWDSTDIEDHTSQSEQKRVKL